MKTKDSEGTARAFFTTITKNNGRKNIWVNKGIEIAWEFKKLCKAEWIQTFSTRSETKAAFAERTIRSLKKIIYSYMEAYGNKYIHKLSQFVTAVNSRKKLFDRLDTKITVKNSDYCPFYTESHYEKSKNPALRLETEFASPSMASPSGRVICHNLHEKILKMLPFLPESFQHTQKRMNRTSLSVINFIEKSLSKSINNVVFYNRVGFYCNCTTISRQNTQLFCKLLTATTECGRSMGGLNFGNILPINVPKTPRGKI